MVGIVYGYDRVKWSTSCFAKQIGVSFCGINTYIPSGYDQILKKTYGNYLELPPISQRGVWHSNLYVNPDVPYNDSMSHWEDFYDKYHPNQIQMTKGGE